METANNNNNDTTSTGTNPTICSLNSLQVLLPDDIRDHIAEQYGNDTARVGQILQAMKLPPVTTICRVNLIQGSRPEIQQELELELKQRKLDESFYVEPHASFSDVLCIHSSHQTNPTNQQLDCTKPIQDTSSPNLFPNWQSRTDMGWPQTHRAVVVDRFCGEAVLRGAPIFVRGIQCADRGIQPGETVAVYADVRSNIKTSSNKKKAPKLKRGCFLEDYGDRVCVYLGLGTSLCKRSDYFRLDKGVGIEMLLTPTARVGPMLPPLSGILPRKLFFQNLPSIVVAHALAPEVGDVILDLCAAPGGKTSHIASLVKNNATIVACDKSRKKMLSVQQMFQQVGATCITPIAWDSTNCVERESNNGERKSVQEVLESATKAEDGLLNISAFYPESFDRILLDPPCSAMGLRPKLQIVQTGVKELQQVCQYQRKFVREAEALLKPGGIMTYSTCTFLVDENERMVRYMLDQFPTLELLPVLPESVSVGGPGLPGMGLDDTQRSYVRRFDPLPENGGDTIGFFVAKFRKTKPVSGQKRQLEQS